MADDMGVIRLGQLLKELLEPLGVDMQYVAIPSLDGGRHQAQAMFLLPEEWPEPVEEEDPQARADRLALEEFEQAEEQAVAEALREQERAEREKADAETARKVMDMKRRLESGGGGFLEG